MRDTSAGLASLIHELTCRIPHCPCPPSPAPPPHLALLQPRQLLLEGNRLALSLGALQASSQVGACLAVDLCWLSKGFMCKASTRTACNQLRCQHCGVREPTGVQAAAAAEGPPTCAKVSGWLSAAAWRCRCATSCCSSNCCRRVSGTCSVLWQCVAEPVQRQEAPQREPAKRTCPSASDGSVQCLIGVSAPASASAACRQRSARTWRPAPLPLAALR